MSKEPQTAVHTAEQLPKFVILVKKSSPWPYLSCSSEATTRRSRVARTAQDQYVVLQEPLQNSVASGSTRYMAARKGSSAQPVDPLSSRIWGSSTDPPESRCLARAHRVSGMAEQLKRVHKAKEAIKGANELKLQLSSTNLTATPASLSISDPVAVT